MCGLGGIIEFHRDVDVRCLRNMIASMRHRGPDQEDLFVSPDGKRGLCSTRLAIIDLSVKASMPMKVNGLVIAFNGEIYNFKSLRKYLERKGERFFSESDTEVVARLFYHMGEKSLDLLRGMFSFAIYHPEEGKIFIARDRLGIKPLYVYSDDERIIFASEVRAILSTRLVKPELDTTGAFSFFSFGSAKCPHTLIKGIEEFPPGHYQWLGKDSSHRVRYWNIPYDLSSGDWKKEEVKTNLRELIEESVSMRLVSDVPLGVFLSGGLDSTIVAAVASKYVKGIRTFSIRFQEEEFDEGEYARSASEFIGTEHSEMIVTPHDVLHTLDEIISSMDLPTIDGVNTYFVSRFTRENGIVVALSGLGGDELFGGYQSFRYIPDMLDWRKSPVLRTGIKAIARITGKSKHLKARQFIRSPGSVEDAYFSIRGILPPSLVESLLEVERGFFNPSIHLSALIDREPSSLWNHITALELVSYMKDMLLRDTDAMSMAHSLEVRVPIIDHRIVEYVLKLPEGLRKGKRFFYETFKDLLPPWMATRKKKGFIFPFERWLKEKSIDIESELRSSIVFNPDVGEKIYQEFLRGRLDWRGVWALFVFERWCKRYNIYREKKGGEYVKT